MKLLLGLLLLIFPLVLSANTYDDDEAVRRVAQQAEEIEKQQRADAKARADGTYHSPPTQSSQANESPTIARLVVVFAILSIGGVWWFSRKISPHLK